ncbi:DUF1127 domain-containing protein [Neorhizobium sp. T25_13]|uniref:DUF1127 domain-containing protein n=1 Tax=Neorhizobium sp. T25_13 TaxID=2093830 RepID=UPI000CF905EA|nr:DUF1127 domain-containing protein [Neorhizobium sp. T25_13]
MPVELLESVERYIRSLPTAVRVSLQKAHFIARWWQRATTEQELRWLSDRDLADIGVARRDIRKVARSRASAFDEPRTTERHKTNLTNAGISRPRQSFDGRSQLGTSGGR